LKAQSRDKELPGETHKVKVGCGTLYVTVNSKNGKVLEVIIQGGKSGGCTFATNEGLARCISLGLRAGVDLQEYTKGLIGIKCNNITYDEGILMNSCPDAVGQILAKYLPKEIDGNTDLR
jgi:ribonucleoside-diphosphate reductase alpha chain